MEEAKPGQIQKKNSGKMKENRECIKVVQLEIC